MTGSRWVQSVVAAATLAMAFTLAAAEPQQAVADLPTCGSSTAPGGYTTTLCVTAPSRSSMVAGRVPVTATVAVTGAAPAVDGIQYTLDGHHLLFDFQSPYQFTLHTYLSTVGPHTLAGSVLFAGGYSSDPVAVPLRFGPSDAPPTPPFAPSLGSEPVAGAPFILATAGDGATGTNAEKAVADLVSSWHPNLFGYLGDVHQEGLPEEQLNWYGENGSYFSRFRSISNPTPGNHAYLQNGTDPYFDYWGKPPDYYSLTTHGWHIISLDDAVNDGKDAVSAPQYQWLVADLKANTAPCTIVQWHRPSFSLDPSGDAASSAIYWKLFAATYVTAVLSGRSQNYQRWQPMDGNGNVSPTGVTQFVVGTGGNGISPFTVADPRAAVGFDTSETAWGAMELGLSTAGATFRFENIAGNTEDFGSIPCQGGANFAADTSAPTTPTAVTATPVSGREVQVSWRAATDDVGVTSYQIVRDGTVVGTVPGYQATFADSTTAALTSYSYAVVAVDSAGNRSGASRPGVATTQAAAPTFVQGGTLGTAERTSSTTMRLDQPVRAGDVLVGWFGQYDAPGQVHVSDDANGAWTRVQGETYSSGNGDVALYYAKAASTEPKGVTVTVSAPVPTYLQAAVGDYWGTAVSGTLATSAISKGSGTVASSGPTVAAPKGSLVFAGLLSGGAPGTMTPGKTNGVQLVMRRSQPSHAVVAADATTTAAGPQEAMASLASATDWYAGTAVFRPASPADATPPTAPGGATAHAPPNSPVAVAWTAANDNISVAGYTVYRNGTTLGDTNADQLSYVDGTATPNASYSYTVVAYDTAGNRSPPSAPAMVTTPPTSPSYVQSGVVSTGSRVRSAAIVLPKAVRAGDLLVGWFGQYDAAGRARVSDDANGDWIRVQGETFATGDGDVALFYVRAARDKPNGVTITVSAASATYLQGGAADYGGTGNPGQLTASALASGTSRAADSGVAAVTTSAGAIVVTGLITGGDPGSAAVTASGSLALVIRSATPSGSATFADITTSASGIQHGAFTLGKTTDWYAMSAVFGP